MDQELYQFIGLPADEHAALRRFEDAERYRSQKLNLMASIENAHQNERGSLRQHRLLLSAGALQQRA